MSSVRTPSRHHRVPIVTAVDGGVDTGADGGAPEAGAAGRHAVTRLIIVLAGLFSVTPSLLGVIQDGRAVSSRVNDTAPPSALGALLGTALSGSIAVVCVGVLAYNLGKRFGATKLRLGSVAPLVIFVLPWLVTVVVDIDSGQSASRQWVLYPLLGLTFWALAPSFRVLDALAWLIVAAAAVALGMGLFDPSLGLYANPGGAVAVDKVIIGGRLLAGPFGHPNLLGGVLALGIPALVAIRRPRVRLLGFLIVYTALLWSASRTAIVAATVAVVAYALLRGRRQRGAVLITALVIMGVYLAVWTPLSTTDPLAYSQRGQIWMAALDYWRSRPTQGFGTNFFTTMGAVNNDLGPYAFTGHNAVVDTLVKTGLVGAAALALLVTVLIVRGVRLRRLDKFPILWVLAFIWEGWLEARIDFTNLGQAGVVVWIPLALILFGTASAPTANGPDRPPGARARADAAGAPPLASPTVHSTALRNLL